MVGGSAVSARVATGYALSGEEALSRELKTALSELKREGGMKPGFVPDSLRAQRRPRNCLTRLSIGH